MPSAKQHTATRKLHVSPLQHGGYTGRPWIHVLGWMDEARVETRRRMDPILLDVERHRISTELWDVNAMQREAQVANVRALARASQYPLTYISIVLFEAEFNGRQRAVPQSAFDGAVSTVLGRPQSVL